MPDSSLVLLILIIVLAVGFGVVNGFNDAANAIAASIGSRALSPRKALVIAAIANMTGAMTGLAVAQTIGKGILIEEATSNLTVISGLLAVIVWGTVATYWGLPVSITHSFVAGLAAAGTVVAGGEAIVWSVMQRVGSSVVAAPILGFGGGFVLMVILYWLFRRSAPAGMRTIFSRLQWLTTAFVAYSHGKNDGQMPIGVITMALFIYYKGIGQVGQANALWDHVPWWVIIISALAISSGIAIGGWRVIRTVGVRVTTLQPVHGFATQASAATVIEIASHLGIPVSTTHCVSAAVMGVGATRRLSAVRWGVAGNIVAAWVLTFPICGGLGYLFAWLLKPIF
ncbi:anion permease [Chloroflexota bacterium]